jgi:hypothetical protein
VSVTISRNEHGSPAETLADADVIVHGEAGPLTELTVIDFVVSERRNGGQLVTFPARPYSLNGTRRSLALWLPTKGSRARKTRCGRASSTRSVASRVTPDGP